MSKRVAVVSGGIGGLGTQICIHLAQSGHTVVALDLDGAAIRQESFTRLINGHDIHFEACDVTDFVGCADAVARAQERYGPVDVLVNAAGITRDVTLRKMQQQQWSDVLRVNLDGVFNLTRQVVDGMAERGYGRIVNISSINGQTGQFGQTNYCAAKAGMHGFTMALARELARKGVTVNSVSPGYCETEMVKTIPTALREQIIDSIPVGRIGQPQDIANAVAFLCSEASGFITGTNLPVNGGLYIGF